MNYEKIKQSLSLIQNPIDKLEMVMDLGKNLTKVPNSAVCTEIMGCASFVQICRDGNRFYGVADSAMVRGIVAIILSMVDGKSIEEIKKNRYAGRVSEFEFELWSIQVKRYSIYD